MPHKSKIPSEEMISAVRAYLRGEIGFTEAVRKYRISESTWKRWVRLYRMRGADGLIPQAQNRKYSSDLKERVVLEYLAGNISLRSLCEKYKISHENMVANWIKRYNGQKGFKNPNSGSGIYMTKGRKTTREERLEIVSYCIANGKDYGKAIEKYQVSYQQIYGWVKKYEEGGVDQLVDKRGKRKVVDKMTEIERLRAENKILRAENEHKEMVIDILKKVKVVERRRG